MTAEEAVYDQIVAEITPLRTWTGTLDQWREAFMAGFSAGVRALDGFERGMIAGRQAGYHDGVFLHAEKD